MNKENIFVEGNILKSNLRTKEYPLFIRVLNQERAFPNCLRAEIIFDATIEDQYGYDIEYDQGCGVEEDKVKVKVKGYTTDWNFENRFDQTVWAKSSIEEAEAFETEFHKNLIKIAKVFSRYGKMFIEDNIAKIRNLNKTGATLLGEVELHEIIKPNEDETSFYCSDENTFPTIGACVVIRDPKSESSYYHSKWYNVVKVDEYEPITFYANITEDDVEDNNSGLHKSLNICDVDQDNEDGFWVQAISEDSTKKHNHLKTFIGRQVQVIIRIVD